MSPIKKKNSMILVSDNRNNNNDATNLFKSNIDLNISNAN